MRTLACMYALERTSKQENISSYVGIINNIFKVPLSSHGKPSEYIKPYKI
jgi:hypothetical protein